MSEYNKLDMSLGDIITKDGGVKRGRYDSRGFNSNEVNIILGNSDDVGRVIGQGGRTIQAICKASGTFITFAKDNQLGTVKGKKESIIEAIGLIAKELGESEGAKEGINLAVIIPQGEVGKIVGSKGATIKKLEIDSGTKISIQSPIVGQQRVDIRGSPEGIHAVVRYIVTSVDFALYSGGTTSGISSGISPSPQNIFQQKRMRTSGRSDSSLCCTISLGEAGQVSKVIGKSGATIKKICQESSTSITFAKDNQVGQVKGERSNVIKAIQLIASELEDITGSLNLTIFVPKDEVAKIIGKKGATIKRIESETGAKVSISSLGTVQPVKLSGSVAAVSGAVEAVFKCINYFSAEEVQSEQVSIPSSNFTSTTNFGFNNNVQTANFGFNNKVQTDAKDDAEITIKCLVENDHVGAIIGHGGSGIKHIARSSGVSITFKKDVIYHENCEVGLIKGKVRSVIRALELITSKIESLVTGNVAVTLIIPSSYIGWIVGKSGATIKETTQRSSAKININKEKVNVAGIEENFVQVEGSSTSINNAVGCLVRQISEIPDANRIQ